MKKFNLTELNASYAIVAIVALTLLPIPEGWAQEKCKRSGTYLAQDSKYTQQHVIDVGDVPGHQVRILEVHRTPSNAKPNCEGLKVVEAWNRGYSDYTNLNGRAWGYDVTVLENGDKIFGQFSGTTQTTFKSDGTKKTLYTGVTTFTGGTGKYRGIRGMSQVTSAFDPKTGFNENQWEDEYWIEH
jgi:hypothetical protein